MFSGGAFFYMASRILMSSSFFFSRGDLKKWSLVSFKEFYELWTDRDIEELAALPFLKR